MPKVNVLTDSTAYLPSSLLDKYQISTIPLTLIWGNETYQDGMDITPQKFYQRLQRSDTLPTTSQPSVESFKKKFHSLSTGASGIIAILISSKISGTVESAQQAKQEVQDQAIEIVDSMTSGMALGLQVLRVADAARQGASLSDCRHLAEKAKRNTNVFFAVDTLEFLHRGGRIGGAKRFLGTVLDIKPILEMREGRIEAVDQVRTQRKATERLIQLMKAEESDTHVRMAVMHSNSPDAALDLLNRAEKVFHVTESYMAELSPVIGSHVGPGTLALACIPDW